MEKAPEIVDDQQPQDLSASSISTVIDLTRKSKECVSSGTSLNTLVKSPGWCPNSATCNPQPTFSEHSSTSDINLQSGDQIHRDNSLSHTTVTLSYLSRSHVSINRDFPSQHSRFSSIPAISKLPLCSPHNSEALKELNQHYSEPVDLDIPTEHFQSSSQTQLGLVDNVPSKESHEVKSKIISRDLELFREENNQSLKNSRGLENGEVDGWESPSVCRQPSPETLVPSTGGDEKSKGFVVSKTPDPVVIPDSIGVRDPCLLKRECIRPLEDPVSPSVVLQYGIEDGFDLPLASSSPSANNCYRDDTGGFVWDGSSSKGANQLSSRLTAEMGPESDNRVEQPVQKPNTTLDPLIDVTGDVCVSDDSEKKPVNAYINGNATALQRTLNEKKLPKRSGRGTRLEAIVMNINSSSYKVSGCIRNNKKPNPSQAEECDTKINNIKSTGKLSPQKRMSRNKASLLENSLKQTVIPVKENKDNCNTGCNTDSTSDSVINHFEKPQNSTPPKSSQFAVHTNSKKQPVKLISDPAVEIYMARVSPHIQSSNSPKKSKGQAGRSVAAPTAAAKITCSPRSRGKKHKGRKHSQCTSMFLPKEPEIKLKYITYKEEKRDLKIDSFTPFVHVERQQCLPSVCTVVNYPEEVRTDLKKSQQLPSGKFATGAVPSTSCLQLGRTLVHSQHQRSLVCCLCGQSANAMDLGDLHGPYYPEGYQPAAKRPAGIPKGEEDDSDSDSSSSTIKERGRKRTVKQPSHHLRAGAQPCSPVAKRAHSDRDPSMIEDWYNPPVLPLEPCEYWLHEDCGIWSAGVYLVKGKVYGLEEAVRVAQETVMLHFCPLVWLEDLQRNTIICIWG